jgi:hypothetical protein
MWHLLVKRLHGIKDRKYVPLTLLHPGGTGKNNCSQHSYLKRGNGKIYGSCRVRAVLQFHFAVVLEDRHLGKCS